MLMSILFIGVDKYIPLISLYKNDTMLSEKEEENA
jgi:hypothetical protein